MKFIFSIALLFGGIFMYAFDENHLDNKKSWLQYNPIFQDNKNTLKLIGALDFSPSGFSHLGALGIHYGQPNTFFRLPGRMALEFEGFIGSGNEKELGQIILGVAQDVILPIRYTNFYIGASIGIYIRTLIDTRIGSAFTFGEKIFIGYAYYANSENTGGGGYSCEIFIKHYSNGSLTSVNKGFNFFGMSVGYSF